MRPTITILLFSLILVSCNTSRKTIDSTKAATSDSSKYWHDQYLGEAATNDILVKQMQQEQFAEFKFQKQPCPDTANHFTLPLNSVQIDNAGAISVTGPLESAKVFRKNNEILNQQHTDSSKYSQTHDRKEYYITKKIETWHTETKKVKPAWWWNFLLFIAGAVAMYFSKPYIDKLKIFKYERETPPRK